MQQRQRQVRTNASGVAVVTYLEEERLGQPWAREVQVVGPGAAELLTAEMQGWVISGSVELGEELRRRGASVLRRPHTMRRDLVADPPPAHWRDFSSAHELRVVPCDRDVEEALPAWRAAFGPGHPDRHPDTDERELSEQFARLLAGEILGPVLPCSALVVDPSDRVVAGAVVNDTPRMPWIGELFRDPAHPGAGSALLRFVLATAADHGLVEIGLAVSDANPARRLYERLGFELTGSYLTVVVPRR